MRERITKHLVATTTSVLLLISCVATIAAPATTQATSNREQDQPTAFAVRRVPDNFEGNRADWIKMFADDPEVQQAMRAAIIEQLKSEVASSHLAGKQVAGINRIGYFVVFVVHVILALALWAAFRSCFRTRFPCSGRSSEHWRFQRFRATGLDYLDGF